MTDAAVAILRSNPGDPLHPEAWWRERQIIARRLLAGANFDLAYQIAAQHGVLDGKAYADANFLLGYIALRFKKDPALAFDDFSHILTRADTPYTKARAAYWGGRAAEAEAKPDLARKWYAAGADHMATFYGQLAAHQLGNDAPPKPVPEPVPTNVEKRCVRQRRGRARDRNLFCHRGSPAQQGFLDAPGGPRANPDPVFDARDIGGTE